MIITEFADALINSGWQVRLKDKSSFNSKVLQTRYSSIPDSYKQFLAKIIYCQNSDNDIWFLCEDDFEGKSDSDFAWNEFEMQSLKAVGKDKQALTKINDFWKTHIPIVISVKDYYSYLAISTKENGKGIIVQGNEPEYEETTKVCNSFSELMEKINHLLNSKKTFNLVDLL